MLMLPGIFIIIIIVIVIIIIIIIIIITVVVAVVVVFALIRAKTIQVKSLQASTMRITYPVAVNCLGWDNLYCAPHHLHSTRIQKDNSYVRGGYWSALSRQNFHDRTRWPNAFRILGSDCDFILTVRLQLKMIVLPF